MARHRGEAPVCAVNTIHHDIVRRVQRRLPDDGLLFNLAELFKVFGDSTRVRIICALLFAEMCVCDISVLLGLSQSAISHQLKILRQARLVTYRRDGKVVYYSLNDRHVGIIFKQGFAHIREQ